MTWTSVTNLNQSKRWILNENLNLDITIIDVSKNKFYPFKEMTETHALNM